jgi:hypothetical protein
VLIGILFRSGGRFFSKERRVDEIFPSINNIYRYQPLVIPSITFPSAQRWPTMFIDLYIDRLVPVVPGIRVESTMAAIVGGTARHRLLLVSIERSLSLFAFSW